MESINNQNSGKIYIIASVLDKNKTRKQYDWTDSSVDDIDSWLEAGPKKCLHPFILKIICDKSMIQYMELIHNQYLQDNRPCVFS